MQRSNCVDFDLCEACNKNTRHNSQHVFLKINRPLPQQQRTAPIITKNLYTEEDSPAMRMPLNYPVDYDD